MEGRRVTRRIIVSHDNEHARTVRDTRTTPGASQETGHGQNVSIGDDDVRRYLNHTELVMRHLRDLTSDIVNCSVAVLQATARAYTTDDPVARVELTAALGRFEACVAQFSERARDLGGLSSNPELRQTKKDARPEHAEEHRATL